MIQIDPKMFYKVGIGCFSIITICAIINFFVFISRQNIFSILASLGNIVFDLALVGFFIYLYRGFNSQLPQDTAQDLNDALKEFTNGED